MTLIPNGETLSFISIHKTDDVRQLALKSRPDGVDMAYALEQIAGWQAARRIYPWNNVRRSLLPYTSSVWLSVWLTAMQKDT